MPEKSSIDPETLLRGIYNNAHDYAIFTFDLEGKITTWNVGAERIIGYTADEIIGKDSFIIFSAEDRVADKSWQEMEIAGQKGRAEDYRWHRRKDGSLFWADGVLTSLHDRDNKQVGYLKILRDITERKLAESEMHRMANSDRLTGLANRYAFDSYITELLSLSARTGQALALLLIDLDHFKKVNDSLGHQAGDNLLQQASARMKAVLRESDFLARMGGDEFALAQPDIHSMHSGAELAGKLIKVLSEPFHIDSREVEISASIGIAVCPHDAKNLDQLLKKADLALYRAKNDGKGRYHYFTSKLDMAAHKKMQHLGALRVAVERKEFWLEYQPKLGLATGQVIGIEALLRCGHPAFKGVPIENVIDLALEAGLMKGLSHWVIREACKQLKEWKKAGMHSLIICINLCAHDLTDPEFPTVMESIMAESNIVAEEIEIEITEREALDIESHGMGTLNSLCGRGIKLVLDDFGTGYSALSYLRDLPIQLVKLDKSFLSDIPDDVQSCAVVKAVMDLSIALGLEVVAEGVETNEQAEFLKQTDCTALQGYLVSPPLPAQHMTSWLSSKANLIQRFPQ